MYNVYVVPKLNAPQSEAVVKIIELIKQAASDVGVSCYVDNERVTRSTSWLNRETMFLAVGGDGTMLQAMKLAAEADGVAFGINLGQVGFLTDLARGKKGDAEFRAELSTLLRGEDQFIEERIVLTMSLAEIAVNEISISQTYADAMITYKLQIGDQDAGVHKANSLLISTPTGSTAYSLSAGGALMTPTIKAIQIVPVAPVRLTSRPIIAPHDQRLLISAWGDGITVRVDGQVADRCDRKFTAEDPYQLEVSGDPLVAKVVHFKGWNFFDMLTQKLGWVKS